MNEPGGHQRGLKPSSLPLSAGRINHTEQKPMTTREQAIQQARREVQLGRCKEEAAEAALRAFPSLKLSRDQLKALAFGATLHGFGKPVPLEAKDHPVPQFMTREDWERAEPAITKADTRDGLAARRDISWEGPEGDAWIADGGTKD